MSCACENRRLAQERDRIYRLAKGWARMEDKEAVIFRNGDGTFGFASASDIESDREIVEYVTPY